MGKVSQPAGATSRRSAVAGGVDGLEPRARLGPRARPIPGARQSGCYCRRELAVRMTTPTAGPRGARSRWVDRVPHVGDCRHQLAECDRQRGEKNGDRDADDFHL